MLSSLPTLIKLRTYIFSLPPKKLLQLLKLVNIPARFIVLIKDLIAFRKRTDNENIEVNVERENKQDRRLYDSNFHNKGIEMINLPKILKEEVLEVQYVIF